MQFHTDSTKVCDKQREVHFINPYYQIFLKFANWSTSNDEKLKSTHCNLNHTVVFVPKSNPSLITA